MVREEIKESRLYKIPHTVQLDALVVVNVQILGLSHCKHGLILHEADISHFVFCLELSY